MTRPLLAFIILFAALPAVAKPKAKTKASPAATEEKGKPDKWGFVKVGKNAVGERWEYPPMGAIVDIPKEFERVEPKKNGDVAYQLALRHKTKRYEIRYQFDTTGESLAAKKEAAECAAANEKKPGSCFRADMSAPSPTWLSTVVWNISEQDPQQMRFPDDAVKKEFGADWGATAVPVETDPRHDFNAGGWKIAQGSVVYKKGAGRIFRIALADDIEVMQAAGRGSFYLARFKGAKPPGLPD